jgi:pentatricopeptide repeat protein
LYSKGQAVNEKEVVVTMVDECCHEKVWEHTLKLFDDMERSGMTA